MPDFICFNHNFICFIAQVYGLFSAECARYKDLIHLHSFMHDFHLNLVLEMLSGEREIPDWLDMKTFLAHFTQDHRLPASYNRNRLERGQQAPAVEPPLIQPHLDRSVS